MDTTHPSGDPRFADLDRTIESYNHESTALIQVLHAAQQMFGHLGADVLRYIAGALKLPVSHVYGVVTFYNFFTMVPRGKHQIMICRGTGCHVRGSDQILTALEKQLGVKEGRNHQGRPVHPVHRPVHRRLRAGARHVGGRRRLWQADGGQDPAALQDRPEEICLKSCHSTFWTSP
jgi:NADH:ubiquinone oxidoreductase subunit E